MGKYNPPNDIQVSQMTSCLAQLDNDLNAYGTAIDQGVVSSFINWTIGSDSSQDAATHAFQQWTSQVQTMRDQEPQVFSGDLSMEGWFSTGKAIHDSLASSTTDVGNWQWSGVVSSTASTTAVEVQQDAKAVASVAAIGGSALLVVAAILGVAYILFASAGVRGA